MAMLRAKQYRKKMALLNLPNMLTVLRMALAPLFVHLLLEGGSSLLMAAFVFTLAALTDYYDGYFARKLHRITKFGAFLDPLADKMLVLGAFGAFMLKGLLPVWINYYSPFGVGWWQTSCSRILRCWGSYRCFCIWWCGLL